MAIPIKWNQTTAQAGPPENRNAGRAVPRDDYVDEAASGELGGLVLKDSTDAWREFLRRLKADRETGKVRDF